MDDVNDGGRELLVGGGGFVLLGSALPAHAEHERVLDHREQPRRGDEGEGRGEEVRVPLKRRGCFGIGFGIFGIFGVVAPGELEQRAPARLGGFVPGGAGGRLVLVVALVAVAARAEQRRRGAPAQELELGDGRLDRRRRPRVRVGHVDVGEVGVECQEVAHARVGARVRRHVRLAAVHDRPASSALHGGRRVARIVARRGFGGAADAAGIDAETGAAFERGEGVGAEGVGVRDVGGWELGDASERRGGERPVVGGHGGRRRLFVMLRADLLEGCEESAIQKWAAPHFSAAASA